MCRCETKDCSELSDGSTSLKDGSFPLSPLNFQIETNNLLIKTNNTHFFLLYYYEYLLDGLLLLL